MKAAYIEETGPPTNIKYGDLPDPKPTGSQALVKVEAVAVNPIDTYIRSGAVAMSLPLPFVVGGDLAGVVEAVGPDATRFRKGDRVWGSNQGLMGRQGTFADYAAVDECWLYPLPDPIAYVDAAAVALVGITAHLGLVGRADPKPGESLFVNGGSGGVGSMVVQMAKALGAKVITTAGSEEKKRRCGELGADRVVNHKTEDIDAAIREFAPDGLNIWWETMRDANFERVLPLLALRGRMIVMAGRDAKPILPVGAFYTKDCALHGFAMFNASPDRQRSCADAINGWLTDGKLKANIDRVLPLSEAAAAHKLQEDNTLHGAGTLAGKIVLQP